ncbi:MAG TPA: hypothetical protein VK737_09400 [Opitutales bacterium]|jgi:hypothetical protein|nr:hypothetical protein [Opitutales bacterium]
MQTINPPSSLNGSHLRTYEKIFQHPTSHNLAWRDVLSLLSHVGEVVEEPNGHLKVTRNQHLLILPVPTTKEVAEVDELAKLRRFLSESETVLPESSQPLVHILVVIDHHQARLFRTEMNGAVPQLIQPHQPNEFFRQAHEDRNFFSGKEKSAPNGFFEPVAKALKDVGQILIFGTGTGTSSEMEQFTVWLKKHHAELARRVVGTVVVDEQHLTEPQLLEKARAFYSTHNKT